ncbi:MAG: hypothetical protein QOI33_2930, partial [Mycobacterium sp.]|nr:hypothetical protein [Mycobacterium sp.]
MEGFKQKMACRYPPVPGLRARPQSRRRGERNLLLGNQDRRR